MCPGASCKVTLKTLVRTHLDGHEKVRGYFVSANAGAVFYRTADIIPMLHQLIWLKCARDLILDALEVASPKTAPVAETHQSHIGSFAVKTACPAGEAMRHGWKQYLA
eukprot:6375292-Amphidinium_carterae.1